MSDDNKSKPGEGLAGPRRVDETRRGGGRMEYDQSGDRVWVPVSGLSSAEVMRRLLDDDSLTFAEDDSRGTARRIQPNPGGLKKGYDPYDSGLLTKKQWKKTKDLRALSRWIESKKHPRREGGEDEG